MSRRTDNGLRHAISVIERMLLTDPSTDAVLMRCLNQLMVLLGSSFGYVYQCRDSETDEVPWELTGCYQLVNGMLKELENTSTSNHIPPSLQAKFLSGRCVAFDVGKLPLPVPHNHPDIRNCLSIPLVDARRIYAVIYLCNAVAGFDAAVESRLRPFVAATSCLLRASSKKSQFQKAVQKSGQMSDQPEMLLGMLDTLFNGVLIVNESDMITLCNTAAASMLGLPRRDVIGAPLSRFLPKGAPKLDGRMSEDKNAAERPAPTKRIWRGVPALSSDGTKLLIDLSAFELRHGEENLRGLVMDDISERMQSASDYHATLQRFQALTNLVPVAILQLNRNWECTYANDTWCEYCQMTPEEAKDIGWLSGLHTSDADKILDALRRETSLTGKFKGELRLQSPLGKVTWVRANASAHYTEEGDISGMIMTFNDITDHLNNERRLQDIAEKDQLTGLINRAFFNDRLEIALKEIRSLKGPNHATRLVSL